MRILLVEDNRRLSDSLRLSLVDEGYAVDVAYDGQEGEELAELTPYALIILDVMLPRRSGVESFFLNQIFNAKPRLLSLPQIIVLIPEPDFSKSDTVF